MELNIIKDIFNYFIPGKEVQLINQNNNGLINDTYLIQTAYKSYILQKLNTEIFSNYSRGLSNIQIVKKWLLKNNFPYEFPKLVSENYHIRNKDIWRLYNYIDGSDVFNKVSNYEQVINAAKCLGKFYNCLNNEDVNKLSITLPNFHSGRIILKNLISANRAALFKRKKNAKRLFEEILNQRKIIQKFDNLCQLLPTRVVHYDTKINNFLYKKNTSEVKAIIDFDTLMPGCVLSDIGDMIRTYSNLEGEESKKLENITADEKIIECIIDGFSSEAILNINEKENLFFGGIAITLLQSIRFLTDFFSNDVYYKTSYEEQNLTRANNQFKLFLSLKAIN